MRRGVVAVIVEQGRLLAIRRSLEVSAPGAVCFPGGGIEPDESEHDALVRELQEELGIEVRPLRALWQSTTRWGVHLNWWLAERVEPLGELQPHPAEVAEAFWLTPDEMAAYHDLLSSNREFLEIVARGEITLG
jgi:8-oxo-dGTP pyrophosphatase MutT (NUDIX family)